MFELLNSVLMSFRSEVYGLHLHFEDDKSITYYLIHAKVAKSKISIHNKFKSNDIKLVMKKIKKNCALAIHVSGQGILIKNTITDVETKEDLINTVFGGIEISSFYTQSYFNKNKKWIALIRKGSINDVLETILNQGVFILGISLLPPAKLNLNDHIFNNSDELSFEEKLIRYSDYLETCENTKLNRNYSFNNISLCNMFLPSFTAISSIYVDKETQLLDTEFGIKQNEYNVYLLSNKLIGISILILFSLLIVNSITIGNLNNKLIEQEPFIAQYNSKIQQIENLTKIRDKKKTFFTSQNVQKNLHYYWLINQIFEIVPKSIVIKSIFISPIQFRSNKVIHEQNTILIDGTSYDGIGVSEYISSIKNITLIKSIKLVYYKKNYDKKGSTFQLKLSLLKGGDDE